jgi:hypothetical protein
MGRVGDDTGGRAARFNKTKKAIQLSTEKSLKKWSLVDKKRT